MLRVDEQEGSRAWCSEEIEGEKGEKERERNGVGGEKRVNGAKARHRGTQRSVEKTAPSFCSEDLCRTGLCVTVSEGVKSSQGRGRREKIQTGQDKTRKTWTG